MLLPVSAIIAGFIALVWGADRFVIGAAATAKNLGVSTLIIGLTIVGFGTSAPEMLVAGMAASQGNPGLAIGNALGSNITNIALVLGATALVASLTVQSSTLKREYPVLLLISIAAAALMWDGELGYWDGLILIGGLVIMLVWMIHSARAHKNEDDPLDADFAEEIPDAMPMGKALFWLTIGLLVLLGSSRLLVWGAVEVATQLGISDMIIGLTIVAIGTSLPELAASIMSAVKGEHDLAIGNVIGSNMYNILAVLSLPGIIAPGPFDPAALTRDIPMMLGLTLALFIMAWGFKGPGRINRFEGFLLLCAFVAYQWMIFLSIAPAQA